MEFKKKKPTTSAPESTEASAASAPEAQVAKQSSSKGSFRTQVGRLVSSKLPPAAVAKKLVTGFQPHVGPKASSVASPMAQQPSSSSTTSSALTSSSGPSCLYPALKRRPGTNEPVLSMIRERDYKRKEGVYRAGDAASVEQKARLAVMRKGGDTGNRTQLLGQHIVQFGKFQGESFLWLMENTLGWVANLVADLERSQEKAVDSNISRNKFLLKEYCMLFPEGRDAVKIKRKTPTQTQCSPVSSSAQHTPLAVPPTQSSSTQPPSTQSSSTQSSSTQSSSIQPPSTSFSSTITEAELVEAANKTEGNSANDVHYQAYLLEGLARWNEDRAADAKKAGGGGPHSYTYSGRLVHGLNLLGKAVLNHPILSSFEVPFKYTGELIGMEYLLQQGSASHAKVLDAAKLQEEAPEDIDEGFIEVEEEQAQEEVDSTVFTLTEDVRPGYASMQKKRPSRKAYNPPQSSTVPSTLGQPAAAERDPSQGPSTLGQQAAAERDPSQGPSTLGQQAAAERDPSQGPSTLGQQAAADRDPSPGPSTSVDSPEVPFAGHSPQSLLEDLDRFSKPDW